MLGLFAVVDETELLVGGLDLGTAGWAGAGAFEEADDFAAG